MPWPAEFDREQIRAAIEEVIGAGLSVDDSLPDTLIANAGELGITPVQLRLWIYDQPKIEWRAVALEAWALRMGFINPKAPLCVHCGAEVGSPEAHTCQDFTPETAA